MSLERGEKNWHDTHPDTAMTGLAIQDVADGKAVEWLEHVSDDQYGGRWKRHQISRNRT